MATTQVIILLMLKRLPVDPLIMAPDGLIFQKTRVCENKAVLISLIVDSMGHPSCNLYRCAVL